MISLRPVHVYFFVVSVFLATSVSGLGNIFIGSSTTLTVKTPNHEWDFRGCTTNAVVADLYEYTTATHSSTSCSPAGVVLSGTAASFVTLSTMSWSGSTSFEVYVRPSALSTGSRVFDFSSHSATAGGFNLNALGLQNSNALGKELKNLANNIYLMHNTSFALQVKSNLGAPPAIKSTLPLSSHRALLFISWSRTQTHG